MAYQSLPCALMTVALEWNVGIVACGRVCLRCDRFALACLSELYSNAYTVAANAPNVDALAIKSSVQHFDMITLAASA